MPTIVHCSDRDAWKRLKLGTFETVTAGSVLLNERPFTHEDSEGVKVEHPNVTCGSWFKVDRKRRVVYSGHFAPFQDGSDYQAEVFAPAEGPLFEVRVSQWEGRGDGGGSDAEWMGEDSVAEVCRLLGDKDKVRPPVKVTVAQLTRALYLAGVEVVAVEDPSDTGDLDDGDLDDDLDDDDV